MARPISWLPRLHDIRAAVAKSTRSHYSRSDLEALFGVQGRAAQKLIGLLPSTTVGTSRLVERDALAGFLERIHAADQPALVLEEQRSAPPKTSRRQLRHLVRHDRSRASLASLPRGLCLDTGRVEITFSTVEELAEVLLGIAQILEDEPDEFVRQFEPKVERPLSEDALELRRMFARLADTTKCHRDQDPSIAK